MEKVYLVFEERAVFDDYTEDVLVGVYAFEETARKVCDESDKACYVQECTIKY